MINSCSRHKTKWSNPTQTPPDFWEMSFVDERKNEGGVVLETPVKPKSSKRKGGSGGSSGEKERRGGRGSSGRKSGARKERGGRDMNEKVLKFTDDEEV